MPELNSSQFQQGQLFEPGDPLEPHEMRRETFMRDPKTQFHAIATPDSLAGSEYSSKWDPTSEQPAHTGTAAAALHITGRMSKSPFVGVQSTGSANTRRVMTDWNANDLADEWGRQQPPKDTPSQPYVNEVEDPGSTSYLHPRTSGRLKRHEDFVRSAEAEGKHVPAIVKQEAEFAEQHPPTTGDVRSEFEQLDWANRGQEPDHPSVNRSRQIPPASDVREVPSNLQGPSQEMAEDDLNQTARRWWSRSVPIDPDKETLK